MALRDDIIRLTGAPTLEERTIASLAPLSYLGVRAARKLGILQQPGLLRTVHRMEGAAESQHTKRAMRLNGGWATSVVGALRDDIEERLRPFWSEPETKVHTREVLPEGRLITLRRSELGPSLPPPPARIEPDDLRGSLGRPETRAHGPGAQALSPPPNRRLPR